MKGVVGASMDHRDRGTPPPAPSNAAPKVADSAETVLQLAIDLYGPALLNQPDKLERLLDEQCPAAASDASLLLGALAEGIPQALMGVSSGKELRLLVPQLEQGLIERRGFNPFGATWAVATWANVLKMDSEGLAKGLETMSPQTNDSAGDEESPASTPTALAVALPVEPPMPVVDEPLIVATVAIEPPHPPEPVASVVAQEPPPLPVPPSIADPVVADLPSRANPLPEVEAAPFVEAPSPIEPATPVASTAPDDPVAPVADAEASTVSDAGALPPWATSAPSRSGHRIGIAGVLVAVVIAIVAIRSFATRSSSDPQTAVVPAPPLAESREVATAAPITEPAAAPAATAAPSVAPTTSGIVDVTTDEPLAGDGEQHEVFVAVDPHRDDVHAIVVQFIGGDGKWDSEPRVVDVSPEALREGRVRVGTIGLRTTKPASATFEYALTAADGRHGLPFTKRFTFAPVAGRPPTLDYVIAPGDLVVGKPFAVTVEYRVGDAKLASIERKVLDPRAGTESVVSMTSVDGLASPKPGRLLYPFAAVDGASRSTVELTLIDSDGLRSEPRRVLLDVAATAATSAATAAATRALPTNASPVADAGCTRLTCGSVVSVRETDAAGRAKNYEVIVRLDDRSIRPFVVQGTWKVGRRVRVSGDRVVAVNAGGSAAPTKARVTPPGRLLPESVPIIDQ